jgi:Mg/Co/Ni transporter MgtE
VVTQGLATQTALAMIFATVADSTSPLADDSFVLLPALAAIEVPHH